MSKIVTYENVAAAAESLAKDDKRPSVRAVIVAMGGGSPNAVLPLLNQWKAGRPVAAAAEIQIDPRIGQIIGEQIVKATASARSEIEQRLVEAEADAQAIAEAGRLAEAELDAALSQVQQLTAQTQAQAGQIEQLRADADAVKADAVERISAARAVARDAVTKIEEAAARERSERESAQVALAKAELRLEALPALQEEIKQLRLVLETERLAKSAAEAEKAAALAKAGGLADRIADTQFAAEKSALIASERLAEQNRSCTELTSSLKLEIQMLQKQLTEKTEKTEVVEPK